MKRITRAMTKEGIAESVVVLWEQFIQGKDLRVMKGSALEIFFYIYFLFSLNWEKGCSKWFAHRSIHLSWLEGLLIKKIFQFSKTFGTIKVPF